MHISSGFSSFQSPMDSVDPKSFDSVVKGFFQQMNLFNHMLDQIKQSSVEINREAESIKQDHQEIRQDYREIRLDQEQMELEQEQIEHNQEQLEKKLDELNQGRLQIQKSQKQIRLQAFVLRLKLSGLFNLAFGLKRDQKQAERQLMKVASMEQVIRQRAALIDHRLPLIKANLQEAELAEKDIEEEALFIENELDQIESTIDKIEEMRDAIEESISVARLGSKTEIVEDKEDDVKEISDSLLNRMQEACLWILANICWDLSQVNQLLIRWAARSDLSLNQPRLASAISWVALGALANTGMQEITFSLEDWTLKSSFHEFTWMRDFAESYRSRAGG